MRRFFNIPGMFILAGTLFAVGMLLDSKEVVLATIPATLIYGGIGMHIDARGS